MASLLRDAAVGEATATAFARNTTQAREAERVDARTRVEAGNQKLQQLKATQLTPEDLGALGDTQSLEIQNLKAEQASSLRANNERLSYSALERFDGSGDIRHLNVMFQDLAKSGSSLYPDIARVDKVTAADQDLIDQQGLSDVIVSNSDVNRSYVKATLKDGATKILDLDLLRGATRYNQYASQKELDRQTVAKEVEMMAALGYTDTSLTSREAFRKASKEAGGPQGADFDDLYTKYLAEERSSRAIRSDNRTENEAEAERRVRVETGLNPGDEGFDEAMSDAMTNVISEKRTPAAVRKLDEADASRAALDEMDFFSIDNTLDLATRAKIEPHIARIEALADKKLDQKDKATLMRINELTHLGGIASELTDEQTGILDHRIFRTVSKYISDNVTGIAQEAAYAAYRNTVRHALFGSVLTTGERKSFIEQFGSLGQQRGPVLAQLKIGLEQVLSNYETLVQTNDPYVIKHRAGMSSERLVDVMDALQERIEMVDDAMSGRTIADPRANQPTQADTKEQVSATTLTDKMRTELRAIAGSR